MNGAAAYWFSPSPSEVTSSRISLDFGLRAADLYFRELVVPEVGRIWFVRQLSWPLAALALHEELARHRSNPPTPTAICHGIEALACKLEYFDDPQAPSGRILGRRAFGRDTDAEVWTFRRLREATNYVRNTHRQAATRAIRVDGGLGFARGSRFDLLELERVGHALADAFLNQKVGSGGTSLRKWLSEWLKGDDKESKRPPSLLRALSPEHPTKDEQELVGSRLLKTSTPASEKRKRLARALRPAKLLPGDVNVVVARLEKDGHCEQANEVVVAHAFGAVLDRARDAVASLTSEVEPGRGAVKVSKLARGDSALTQRIDDLRTVSRRFLEKADTANVKEATSRSFAHAVVVADNAEAIRILARRSGELLGLANDSVTRGPLFRVVDGSDEATDVEDAASSIEPDRTGRTFRIANFHALLRDVHPKGAR